MDAASDECFIRAMVWMRGMIPPAASAPPPRRTVSGPLGAYRFLGGATVRLD